MINSNQKLKKEELTRIAILLRGRRDEIAERAEVSVWTVNNTFQDKYQNAKVIKVLNEMLDEEESKENEDVVALRKKLALV